MSLTREQKENLVEDLTEKIEKDPSMIFVDFEGLKVKESENLRDEIYEKGGDYMVVKKTLLRIAMEKAGIDFNPEQLEGQLAVAFDYDSEIEVLQSIHDFFEEKGVPVLRAGFISGDFTEKDDLEKLATLPSRDALLGKVVGVFAGQFRSLIGALSGNQRELVSALSKIKEQKE